MITIHKEVCINCDEEFYCERDIILCDNCINLFDLDKLFILIEDLRDFVFKEDSKGNRYRERIIDVIEKIGVENWFKSKGYPIDEKSVWKNRYGGGLKTLGEDIHEYDKKEVIIYGKIICLLRCGTMNI